jgi:hypothetical protein
MKLVGQAISGSSNAPARTTMKSGRFKDALNNGVPHFGQKLRRMTFPLSAVQTYSLASPVISTLSVLKIALTEALPDEMYWQSLHQHARVAIGGWLQRNRTAPQKHLPVMDFAILDTSSLRCGSQARDQAGLTSAKMKPSRSTI